MIIVEPSAEVWSAPVTGENALRHLEEIGRVSWKSEGKMTDVSAGPFVAMLIKAGHESVLEHVSATVRFVVDRGVSHELVRHRIASYTQESTRYCNYNKTGEVTFIRPPFWADDSSHYLNWIYACQTCEAVYLRMIQNGAKPQEARAVLPNSVKTELYMTANLREWRHFFRLRTDNAAHPQMRQVTIPLLCEFKDKFPVVFDDVTIDLSAYFSAQAST